MRLVDDPQMYTRLALLSAAPNTFEPQLGNMAWQRLEFDERITLRLNFNITGGCAEVNADEFQILFEPIRRDFSWWKLWRWFGYWRMKQKRLQRRVATTGALRDQGLEALQRTSGVTARLPMEHKVIL